MEKVWYFQGPSNSPGDQIRMQIRITFGGDGAPDPPLSVQLRTCSSDFVVYVNSMQHLFEYVQKNHMQLFEKKIPRHVSVLAKQLC